MKRKILKNVLVVFVLSLALMALIPSVFSKNVYAGSYPLVIADEMFQEECAGNKVELKYIWFPEFKNEKISIEIFDPNGECVGTGEKSFYNTSTSSFEFTFNWNTKMGYEEGQYKIVGTVSFYSMYEWHENPSKVNSYVTLKDHDYEFVTIQTATTKRDGSCTRTCNTCGEYTECTVNRISKITLSKNSFVYNGKMRKPIVEVVDTDNYLLLWDKDPDYEVINPDYSVMYDKGRTNVGSYKVTVKFMGDYEGTVIKTFKIVPKSTTLSKLTAGKKQFKATWKKQAVQTTGYEVRYAQSSAKLKNAKPVVVKGTKVTNKTFKNLKAKTKYYVQIRTYKTVNGVKYYSSWSKAKTVTTK